MLKTGVQKILVPVATGEAFGAAAEYAAAQARRRGVGIHVVTVLHPVYLGPPAVRELSIVEGELRAAGSDVLIRAEHQIRLLLGEVDLPVSTELVHGPLVPSLVHLSAQAALVVLERQHHAPLPRIVTMSVTNGLAARSHAPVVTVPPGWAGAAAEAPVVIGVEDPDDPDVSGHVVRLGLEAARSQHAPARLVHGWWYTDAYDDLVFAGDAAAHESARRRARLLATYAPLLGEYDDVAVETLVRHAHPADLLVAVAGRAAAVVLGRHHPSFPLGSHLGPVTRAVLRESPCPVLVDPARRCGTGVA